MKARKKCPTRISRVCGIVSGQDDGILSCWKFSGATLKVAPARTCSSRRLNFFSWWCMTWKEAARGLALIVGTKGQGP